MSESKKSKIEVLREYVIIGAWYVITFFVFLWDAIKTVANNKVKNQQMIVYEFGARLGHRYESIIFQWFLPWEKQTRHLGFAMTIESFPSCKIIYGYSVPFLFCCRATIVYNRTYWINKRGKAPAITTDYSFNINADYVTFIFKKFSNPASFEFKWREKLKSIIHHTDARLVDVGGWVSSIVPLDAISTFEKETLSAKIKCFKLVSVKRNWFTKIIEEDVYYEVVIDPGIIVPADYNVYENDIMTRTIVKGPQNHSEAIAKFVDLVKTSRKRRPSN